MIYLDLQKQKRTLEPNEFTIDASSEEAKAFFTTKSANQELVIDLENKTTYFEEYEMQEDGTRYAIYKAEKVDGVYIPDLEAIEKTKLEVNKANKLAEAKQYLLDTDFKVLPDYDQDSTEVKVKRQEAREFIRANEGDN